jgi:Tol biopolymer transport system component
MYYGYRERIRNRYWAIAIICILVLLAILGAPRIKDIQPQPDSDKVPSSAPIRITFNQPMDRVSVETRLKIEPQITGRFVWEGNSLNYLPDAPWPQGQEVTVHLAAGSRSSYFLPLLKSNHWSFQVSVPRVITLVYDGNTSLLQFIHVDTEDRFPFVETPLEILDFNVSPDGTMISYSIMRQDEGSDLRVIDLISGDDRLILECPSPMRCQNPHLSSDNELMVFERVELQAGVGGKWLAGFPQVLSVNLEEGSQPMPIGSINHAHSEPHWSSDRNLAYYDETLNEIHIVDLTIQSNPIDLYAISSELGIVGNWSPDGEYFIFPDVVILEETFERNEVTGDEFPLFYSHIFRLSLSMGLVNDLSGTDFGLVEDASPAYSPDGFWIAFTRKFLDEDRWSLGRQLWLMRSDGTGAVQITQDPEYNHFSISWSPDSKLLTFVRMNQNNLTQPPEIWLYDLEDGRLILLESGGYLPQWVP